LSIRRPRLVALTTEVGAVRHHPCWKPWKKEKKEQGEVVAIGDAYEKVKKLNLKNRRQGFFVWQCRRRSGNNKVDYKFL